jgi:hypothetical protein
MYCPDELVAEIIIVDNSEPCTGSRWRRDLSVQYGRFADRVRFIPASELSEMPAGTGGWYSQQVLKLKIADVIKTARYVLLDSKNHLVSSLRRDFLETGEGVPRSNGYAHVDKLMRTFLERTLRYLGINPALHFDWFPRTATPFTMLTSTTRELIRFLESREEKPFAAAFLEHKFSEFFLYSGYLEMNGVLRTSYEFNQPHSAQIWEETADKNGCTEAIQNHYRTGSPFMSIHRKAIKKLDRTAQLIMAGFWQERGLFPSIGDGLRFLRNPNGSRQDQNGRIFPISLQTVAGELHYWKSALKKR